jgi:uncharacterized protein YdeI (YjbR/CyaY-like superfamily)
VVYAEAVEASLRYGWIDGQVKRVDEDYYVQRFTPRRARSRWSKINCAKAEALIASGAMEPDGLAEVERAKADGRWDAAYDAPSTATVPEDLPPTAPRGAVAAHRQATSRSGARTSLARMSSSAATPTAPGSSRACGSASGSA